MPRCEKFEKTSNFLRRNIITRRRYYVFNYSSEEHRVAQFMKIPFCFPELRPLLTLCASNLLEGIYLASRIYRAPLEKNFASRRGEGGVEKKSAKLARFLGKKAARSSTFIFYLLPNSMMKLGRKSRKECKRQ